MKCLFCKKEFKPSIKGHKFCSVKCYNNSRKVKCKICGKLTISKIKVCRECQRKKLNINWGNKQPNGRMKRRNEINNRKIKKKGVVKIIKDKKILVKEIVREELKKNKVLDRLIDKMSKDIIKEFKTGVENGRSNNKSHRKAR